jgi:deoxyuridine 5'-triphosphate nucleotidohydrolase
MNLGVHLPVKLLNEYAQAPVRAKPDDAGLDLFSAVEVTVKSGSRAVVSTGIAIAVPPGTYGRVAPRSGMALKYGIDVLAGVVDCGYRGEVCVVLYNTGIDHFLVRVGDRIAQLIIEKIAVLEPIVVKDLGSTQRGRGGFGSTGGSK